MNSRRLQYLIISTASLILISSCDTQNKEKTEKEDQSSPTNTGNENTPPKGKSTSNPTGSNQKSSENPGQNPRGMESPPPESGLIGATEVESAAIMPAISTGKETPAQ